ncbi:MAG: PIN domain-containing protein [Candidatus Diapherotrites archaeon]|nr:PIN domain-containing protein [Candidatus Diapherotrites archaeon]
MYFFDTYALLEWVAGNPAYEEYGKTPIYTGVFQLLEFAYITIRNSDLKTAEKEMNYIKANIVQVDQAALLTAAVFRYEYRAQKLSYADAIGYTLSRRNKLLFLTGDSQFKGLENVEFIK